MLCLTDASDEQAATDEASASDGDTLVMALAEIEEEGEIDDETAEDGIGTHNIIYIYFKINNCLLDEHTLWKIFGKGLLKVPKIENQNKIDHFFKQSELPIYI